MNRMNRISQLLRVVDDQGQQPGQRRVKIIQPEFPGPPASRRGDGERGGTAEWIEQPGGAHGQILQDQWRQRPLAALILEVLGNGHRLFSTSSDHVIQYLYHQAAMPEILHYIRDSRTRTSAVSKIIPRIHQGFE